MTIRSLNSLSKSFLSQNKRNTLIIEASFMGFFLFSWCALFGLAFFGCVCLNDLENPLHDSYLVDPASSHMLVSKIKPCMSKYKQFIL